MGWNQANDQSWHNLEAWRRNKGARMMQEVENDIGTALMRLRQAFARHNIPCPDVLEYSNQEKAYAALAPLRHAIGPANWGMTPAANTLGEVSLAGFSLRFEPKSIEWPGTGEQLDDGVSGRVYKDDTKGTS